MSRRARRLLSPLKRLAIRAKLWPDPLAAFNGFEASVHPKTWANHDQLLQWAEQMRSEAATRESPEAYHRSQDPVVRQGYELAGQLRQKFQGCLSHQQDLRVLVQVPTTEHSPAGSSLFSNLLQGLQFLGLSARAIDSAEPLEQTLATFRPSVLMASDGESYLSQIDWPAVASYARAEPLLVGLTAQTRDRTEREIEDRFRRAQELGVSFFFCFDAAECCVESYGQYTKRGYPVLSIEFGANPLLYYPVPGIERDLDYVFLGSSNQDKWPRYFAYFSDLLRNWPGLVDGPGWSRVTRWATPDLHRYLCARAKVGLNLSIDSQILHSTQLNERTYNLAACGVPQLIDNPKLLPERFDGDCLFIAKSAAEYITLFRQILAEPAEASRRALRAQEQVLTRHTVFHRAKTLAIALAKMLASEGASTRL